MVPWDVFVIVIDCVRDLGMEQVGKEVECVVNVGSSEVQTRRATAAVMTSADIGAKRAEQLERLLEGSDSEHAAWVLNVDADKVEGIARGSVEAKMFQQLRIPVKGDPADKVFTIELREGNGKRLRPTARFNMHLRDVLSCTDWRWR